MTSSSILSLSTQVEKPKTFTVDDIEYDLLGLAHLSATDEAEVTAFLSRFEQAGTKLDRAKSDSDAVRFAQDLRKRRIGLITKMTTIPVEIAEKLPLAEQIKLFAAVRDELSGDADVDSVGIDDGDDE